MRVFDSGVVAGVFYESRIGPSRDCENPTHFLHEMEKIHPLLKCNFTAVVRVELKKRLQLMRDKKSRNDSCVLETL